MAWLVTCATGHYCIWTKDNLLTDQYTCVSAPQCFKYYFINSTVFLQKITSNLYLIHLWIPRKYVQWKYVEWIRNRKLIPFSNLMYISEQCWWWDYKINIRFTAHLLNLPGKTYISITVRAIAYIRYALYSTQDSWLLHIIPTHSKSALGIIYIYIYIFSVSS